MCRALLIFAFKWSLRMLTEFILVPRLSPSTWFYTCDYFIYTLQTSEGESLGGLDDVQTLMICSVSTVSMPHWMCHLSARYQSRPCSLPLTFKCTFRVYKIITHTKQSGGREPGDEVRLSLSPSVIICYLPQENHCVLHYYETIGNYN